MKTRIMSLVLVLVLLASVLAGCGKASNGGNKTQKTKDEHSVDLQGKYTVKDPEGVKYDKRIAVYKPYIDGDEDYKKGARYSYIVIYSLKDKGQYMYTVDIYDTKEHAAAYQKENSKATLDGTAVVTKNDATFFTKMEAFIPTLNDFISNEKQSGYMDLK